MFVQHFNQFGHEKSNLVPSLLVTQRDRDERSKRKRAENTGAREVDDYAGRDERAFQSQRRVSDPSNVLGESNLPDIYKKFFMEDIKANEAGRGD